MKQAQYNYVMNRINKVISATSYGSAKPLSAKETALQKSVDKLEENVNKIRNKISLLHDNIEKLRAPFIEKMKEDARKISDELMLGDETAALELMRQFEKDYAK